MKKALLTTAITAATLASTAMVSSAQAATLYNDNGLSYQLKGDWQIQLRQDLGDDQNLDVEFDDLELKNRVVYELDDNLKAFGQLDFGFKDAAEGKGKYSTKLEEAYVGLNFSGLDTGQLKVSIGKRNFASDEFGVDAAYENKLAEDGFDEQGTSGDDVIRADLELDNITLIASTELKSEGEASANGESFDLFASSKIAGIELAAAYQSIKATAASDSVDTIGISAAFKAGPAKVGIDYSSTDDVQDQFNLVAKLSASKSAKVALGITTIEPENGDDILGWYANVTYKFPAQKNVSLIAEIADTDEDSVDMGYLAGLRIKF